MRNATIEVRRALAITSAALVFAMTLTAAVMLSTRHAQGSYCEVADANARIVYCPPRVSVAQGATP
jgi:hypothetical protein